MNKPTLAIVGRPNVGKSALFNRICNKRIAIVDAFEGITRDRLYGEADIFGFPFHIVDTGGIDSQSTDQFQSWIRQQAEIAIDEADSLVLLVDSRTGMTARDYELARLLLKKGKPLTLAVNKIDDSSHEDRIHQFHSLGIKKMIGVSALQGYNIAELLELAWEGFKNEHNPPPPVKKNRVSIVGRANVGKSTLLNALLNEERTIVSPIPGTTRDSIDVSFQWGDKEYILVDTAGIRRKKAETTAVEKFAAIRTEKAIERSDVCLLILDARDGVTTQEKHIANQIEAAGKGCVLLLNKWDLVKGFRMEHCLQAIHEESPFLAQCPLLMISALEGRNLDKIFTEVERSIRSLEKRITTHQLNKFVEKSVQLHHPPMLKGKRLRIYYMTQVDINPPRFVLFVNQPKLMSADYKRYLTNQFRAHFGFHGAPLELYLRGKEHSSTPQHHHGLLKEDQLV